MTVRNAHFIAQRYVVEAGGMLVGRTRLQKVACLTQLAGLADEFQFEYRHFGPFSEDLARSMEIAAALDLVYTANGSSTGNQERELFIRRAARISAIELELAATAAYLFKFEDVVTPWTETAARKPGKAAGGRLDRAKDEYRRLREETGNRLPLLPSD